jgi:hypothetical protein
MFIVVPMDEGPGPLSCRVEFGETTHGYPQAFPRWVPLICWK